MAKTPKPGVMVEKHGARLRPVSDFDEELLAAFPDKSLFELKAEPKRSGKLHRTYWKALSTIVAATEQWPTADHLHDALMWDLGYVTVEIDLKGKPHLVRDSTAFASMPSDVEFKPYFDAAMRRLSEVTGIDPLAFLEA